MKHRSAILPLLLLTAAPAFAQSSDAHSAHHAAAATADPKGTFSDGEVRKVDKAAGKVTIKHGPLANLDMPPMTMVFRVKDPAALDQMKAGDRIRFKAEKVDGNYVVTEFQPAK